MSLLPRYHCQLKLANGTHFVLNDITGTDATGSTDDQPLLLCFITDATVATRISSWT